MDNAGGPSRADQLDLMLTYEQQAHARTKAERDAARAERDALRVAMKILDGHLADVQGSSEHGWERAALRVGEALTSDGPDGYYSFTPILWQEWALTAVEQRDAQWQAKWARAVDHSGTLAIEHHQALTEMAHEISKLRQQLTAALTSHQQEREGLIAPCMCCREVTQPCQHGCRCSVDPTETQEPTQ